LTVSSVVPRPDIERPTVQSRRRLETRLAITHNKPRWDGIESPPQHLLL
jgi:hypothetical protein